MGPQIFHYNHPTFSPLFSERNRALESWTPIFPRSMEPHARFDALRLHMLSRLQPFPFPPAPHHSLRLLAKLGLNSIVVQTPKRSQIHSAQLSL